MLNFLGSITADSLLPYGILWLATFMEGPITLLAAGAGIALGRLLPLPAFLAIVTGNLTADLGWYSLGRFGKHAWIERLSVKLGLDPAGIQRLGRDVRQYAPRLVFLSKLTVGLPIPTLIAVGLERVALRRWIAALVSGELIKSAILIFVGYLYAQGIQQTYGVVQIVLWIFTALILSAVWIYFKVYRKKDRSRKVDADGSQGANSARPERKVVMNSSKQNKGLVLIAAYNEEERIADVVCAAKAYLPVLVVDDGSTDATVQRAEKAGARVHSYKPNQGKGMALKAGIQQALEGGYDFIITLDGDGQHDPQEIPAFLDAYRSGRQDLIIGRRDFRKMPTVRRISNTLGTLLFSWAVAHDIPDNQSGYRLVSRRLMEVLHDAAESGYEFEVEMIVYCLMHKFPIGWVGIRTIYGDEKSKINPLHHLRKFIQVSLRARSMLHREMERY
ncbi:MAG: hypothetical protein PWQ55_2501 [Chloroflexota bacterium]|nr:hypothetical protein [Chloroflexota bacterium]